MIYSNIIVTDSGEDALLEDMSNENILDRLDKIAEQIDNDEIRIEYKHADIPVIVKSINNNICDNCDKIMIQSYDRTFYECTNCHLNKSTFNMIDSTKSIPRSKIGNFNPERHFKTWVDRIFAKESEDELRLPNKKISSVDIIDEIKTGLVNKSKSSEHITIDDIRLVLKDLEMTTLNKNTSLIAKKITGRSPPSITDDQYMQMRSLFASIMEARDKIGIEKCNRIYYPYYIAKLLDIILKDHEQRKILNYIHLHKESTLSSNDDEWELICDMVPALKDKYTPTMTSTSRYI